MSKKKKGNTPLFNFRADLATLNAIEELAEAYQPKPGILTGVGVKSAAIRQAILEAAARLKEKKKTKKET